MSLSSILSIAKTALQTHQKSMEVSGHNIANATTPGYTRQKLAIQAAVPQYTPLGTVGRGVTDVGVFATRDRLLDATFRREQAASSQSGMLHQGLSQVEQAFNEPGDNGLGAAFDRLFNAFADLADSPSSAGARSVVQQTAKQLVSRLHGTVQQIDEIDNDARVQIGDIASQVNSLVSRIADLNGQIVARGGANHTAPDLEDQRGLLVDQLSALVSVRVVEHADGGMGVIAGDTLLVDNGLAQSVETRGLPGGGLGLALVGNPDVLDAGGGKLAALTQLTDTELPAVRGKLDQIAAALVSRINTLHRSGTTSAGATNTDFFDPAGVTARSITIAAPILANGTNIAAGATANVGDGSVALQMAQLRTTALPALGNVTVSAFYNGVVAGLGASIQTAEQEATAADVLSANAAAARSSQTGVSTDEELTALITQQQAYSAAARLIRTADEMMQDLLQMV